MRAPHLYLTSPQKRGKLYPMAPFHVFLDICQIWGLSKVLILLACFLKIIIQVSLAWAVQLTQSALYQFSDVEQIVRLPHVDTALPYNSCVLFYKNVLEQGVQNNWKCFICAVHRVLCCPIYRNLVHGFLQQALPQAFFLPFDFVLSITFFPRPTPPPLLCTMQGTSLKLDR